MANEQRYKQYFDKIWKNSFFAFINNQMICLLCDYQPIVVKKFVINRYKNKYSNEYSKYVSQEKYNLIEII